MKKIYTLISILVLSIGAILAQAPANRTINTIVADVLAQLPADKPSDYEKLMKELISTKEAGILQLVGMMKAPDKGKNATIEYALAGLTFYASTNDEGLRLTTSQAYLKALDTTTERETLAFIIRQLQIVGKNEAVDKLASYLNNEKLARSVARALATIGTDNACDVLLKALPSANSNIIKAEIVSALGFMKASKAESEVIAMLNSNDAILQRSVVYALSELGNKESLKELAKLAKESGYKLESIGATAAYTKLIGNLITKGEVKDAEKAAKGLMKDAQKAEASNTRQAAMKLIVAAKPSEALKLALDAVKDPCSQYRFATLETASSYMDRGTLYSEIMKVFPKAKPQAKIDIAGWIEEEAKCAEKRSVMSSIKEPFVAELGTKDLALKKVLSKALVQLKDKSVIAVFASHLNGEDEQEVTIIKEALATTEGNISDVIINNVNTSKDCGKIAIIELLGLRKASNYLSNVISLTNTGSDDVKKVAYANLRNLVEAKDLKSMCSLLENSEKEYIADLQFAVISSLQYLPENKRFATISEKFGQTTDEKKYLYYTALASTEDSEALGLIVEGIKSNNTETRDAAFDALANWKDINGAEYLYDICKNPITNAYFDKALNAYIRLASSSKLKGENRFIYLREAMDIAKTNKQKNLILSRISGTNSFQGLLFAGQFLEDKDLGNNAALAVSNIAMANPSFTGDVVRELLDKSIVALDYADSQYQKEAIKKHLREVDMRNGFISIFNGKDLTGWKGLVKNPIQRKGMKPAMLAREQAKADKLMRSGWYVEDGQLIFRGEGDNICTNKQYGDFEMYVDWKLDPAGPEADAGIYLRGAPQVQIWDTSRVDVGAQVGSGGLYNNTKNESKPLKVADNKLGMWNTFYIKMVGDRVTVRLNGELVVDNVIMENYWDRSQPIFSMEQIELQAHGSKVYYRDIYVKELKRPEPFELSSEEKKEGYKILFDGTNMHEWTGNTVDYILEDGCISMYPSNNFGGNLYTKKEFGDFVYRFEFQLTPGANNGLGIRTPMEGDAAYVGMELQILDHDNPIYKDITKYQVHGSVYGIIAAKREGMKPVGEWNYQEVVAKGDNIKITLNGHVIVDGNIRDAVKNGTPDGKEHPGLFNKSGHIGFLGHGSPVKFKNIRIKELK